MPQSHTALSHMPAPDRHAGPTAPRQPDPRQASPTRATPGPDRHAGPTDYPSQTAASASVGARRAARTAG
ncbi:hypothetical protein LUPAC06_03061 [Micromonospora saelicesensis]|nr:hypothetical protein LUPAC06_03061 [Micromonospora saelicesensis]